MEHLLSDILEFAVRYGDYYYLNALELGYKRKPMESKCVCISLSYYGSFIFLSFAGSSRGRVPGSQDHGRARLEQQQHHRHPCQHLPRQRPAPDPEPGPQPDRGAPRPAVPASQAFEEHRSLAQLSFFHRPVGESNGLKQRQRRKKKCVCFFSIISVAPS